VRAEPRGGAVRPSISPLVWVAGAVWLSSLAGSEAALRCWLDGGAGARTLAWGAAAALGVTALLGRPRALRPVMWACALAFVVALSQGLWAGAAAVRLEQAGPRDWTGTVSADPRTGSFGTTVDIRLDAAPWGVVAVVAWPARVPLPGYGSRVLLSSRLRALVRLEGSADSFRRRETLRASPWSAEVTGWAPGPLGAVAAWRSRCLRTLGALGGASALLASMLFGVPASGNALVALEDARTAGVAWAVTASGLHLAALVLAAGRLAGVFGAGRRGRALVTVAVLASVTLAAGLRLALVRATVAAAASALARLAGRRRDATAALGAAVLLLVVPDPAAAFDVGLLLGALALTAIALYGTLAQEWLRPVAGRNAGSAIGSSLAAQWGVAPLSATLFGGVALLGPLVLVATAPLAGGAACVGMAGALVLPIWSGAGEALLSWGAGIAAAASALWAWVARMPGAFVASDAVPLSVWMAWAVGSACLWAGWPEPRRAARVRIGVAFVAVLCAVAMWAGAGAGAARIEVLDVGQGEAVLVRDGSHALLVDTGPDPVALRRALARAGVRALEGVVLTHAHDDHTAGLPGLAGVARPAWIAVPDVQDDAVDALATACTRRADKVLRLRRDMVWTVGRARIRVLWPRGGERMLDANDTSVVLLVEMGGGRALLLGDAEERAQRGVLDAWPTRVDMVKVAHHGSPNGNVPAALAVWAPARALISVGAGNRFGHPSATALATLAGVGARVERTDLLGDLTWVGGPAVAPVSRAASAGSASLPLCDNPQRERQSGRIPVSPYRTVVRWLPATSATSSPCTSSMAPRSSCWSAPWIACVPVSPRWPTSTSTSRPSTGARAPPTRS
jgi:competence protein ComEC